MNDPNAKVSAPPAPTEWVHVWVLWALAASWPLEVHPLRVCTKEAGTLPEGMTSVSSLWALHPSCLLHPCFPLTEFTVRCVTSS